MAHDLYIEDGQAALFYVGKEPWHKLGTKLAQPATAAEAIQAAKLDWEVAKYPLYAVGDGVKRAAKGRYAIAPKHRWKKPDCPIFGYVGEGYTPLQNREAFEFFDGIVGQGAAVYHTAGALGKGERVWLLAKLPDEIRVADDDITDKYLLLSNSHDGASSVQVKFTPIRVVCNNTLTMALNRGPRAIRVPHTRDLKQRLAAARQNLKIIHERYQEVGQAFEKMVQFKMDEARLRLYLSVVFPEPEAPPNETAIERVYRDRARAAFLFENGTGNTLKGVAGTMWAAYNGVAELIDHGKTRRTDSQRLEHIWFGSGAGVKARAFARAAEMAAAPAA